MGLSCCTAIQHKNITFVLQMILNIMKNKMILRCSSQIAAIFLLFETVVANVWSVARHYLPFSQNILLLVEKKIQFIALHS